MSPWHGVIALVASILAVVTIVTRHDATAPEPIRTRTTVDHVESDDVENAAPGLRTELAAINSVDFTPDRDWLDPPDVDSGSAETDVGDVIVEHDGVLTEFNVARNGDLLLVPVSIGGREYQFIVDTGFTCCVVDSELRSNLHQTEETAKINGQGRFTIYHLPRTYVRNRELKVSGPAICMNLQPFRELTGYDIRGILGMTFLKRHVIQIDFDAGTLKFLRACPANAGRRFALSYTRGRIPSLDLDVGHNDFVTFELDTGAASHGGQLTPDLFDRLTRTGQLIDTGTTIGRLGVHGPQYWRQGQLERLRLVSFELDSFEHANLKFEESEANRLALGYLSRYVVTFDFQNDWIYLKKGARFDEPSLTDLFGAQVLRIGRDTIVQHVVPSSRADWVGMHSGDRLLTIDGADCSGFTLRGLQRLFTERGSRFRLVVQDDGEARELEVSVPDWEKFGAALRGLYGDNDDESACYVQDVDPASLVTRKEHVDDHFRPQAERSCPNE